MPGRNWCASWRAIRAVTLTAAMSSGATSAPRPLPALARIWDGAVQPLDVDRLVRDADVVFLALPEAASAELAPTLLERGARVIDLSGAFRIRSDADRQRWYPATAALPAGTVYGLSERSSGRDPAAPGWSRIRAAIRRPRSLRSSRCIAPGCSTGRSSSTRSPASRAPARRRPSARTSRRTTAASPPTACSRTATRRRSSRSLAPSVTFVPHLVPLDRGILETIYGTLRPGTTEAAGRRRAARAPTPTRRSSG